MIDLARFLIAVDQNVRYNSICSSEGIDELSALVLNLIDRVDVLQLTCIAELEYLERVVFVLLPEHK